MRNKLDISIVTNNSDFLPVTLMSLGTKNIFRISIIDTGGRSILHSKAVLKVLDYFALMGIKVEIERYRKKCSLLKLRQKQIRKLYEGGLILDDDIIVNSEFINFINRNKKIYNVISHSVASVDDAENFGLKTPFSNELQKWTESFKIVKEKKFNFWTACTYIDCKISVLINGISGNIDEGEEVFIENKLREYKPKSLTVSGYRVFHMGNEWTVPDLICKLDLARSAIK